MNFTIKEGKHYSDGWLYKTLNCINSEKYQGWMVVFQESCLYDLGNSDQADINKLVGFSIGLNHHRESVRFGWRAVGEKIEILAYAYISGNRVWEPLSQVNVEEPINLFIEVMPNCYRWSVIADGTTRETRMIKTAEFRRGYMLWPYFGGNQVAPHDMTIEIIE